VEDVDYANVWAETREEAIEIARVRYPEMHWEPVSRWGTCFKCCEKKHELVHTMFLYSDDDETDGACDMCGTTAEENERLWREAKEHPKGDWYDPAKIRV
jgi:hypothetical protein